MYQMVEEPTAWMDAEWDGLDEEGFETQHSIRVKVVFLPLSEMEKMLTSGSEERTVELAKRVSRDWSGIVGPDKKPFPFTAENLERMFELTPGFAAGFGISYINAYRGRGKVREKNSDGSPPVGPAGEEAETKPPAPQSS